MSVLSIASPIGSDRKPVEIMYPALTIRIASERASGALHFERLHDDLDELDSAYLEADGIPVVFQRRPPEPVDVYTVYLDLEGVVEQGRKPLAFLDDVLRGLQIDVAPLWVSDQLTPLHRLSRESYAMEEPPAPTYTPDTPR